MFRLGIAKLNFIGTLNVLQFFQVNAPCLPSHGKLGRQVIHDSLLCSHNAKASDLHENVSHVPDGTISMVQQSSGS